MCFFLLFVSFHAFTVYFPHSWPRSLRTFRTFTTLGSASFSVLFSLRDLLELHSLHSWAVSPGFGHSGPLQSSRTVKAKFHFQFPQGPTRPETYCSSASQSSTSPDLTRSSLLRLNRSGAQIPETAITSVQLRSHLVAILFFPSASSPLTHPTLISATATCTQLCSSRLFGSGEQRPKHKLSREFVVSLQSDRSIRTHRVDSFRGS